ncbi:MAG: apolipoprotein N-acyltransferase [Holosporales bacterium]|jgi:apolipoprotein N-acyltransferase|nr:apolipoprotein N-acyltransferase [Holosporales bacterium]
MHKINYNCIAAFLWGCAAGLGFAPFHYTSVLLLAYAWFYKSLSKNTHRFRRGWFFGFGQALVCLYWVYEPLTLNWPHFAVFIPFSIFILPGYIALYTGLSAKMHVFFADSWWRGPTLFAAQWTLAEWMLGHFFTGFPWTLIGYTWLHPLPLLQIAAYGGIYGLSFFTALLSAFLGEAWECHKASKMPVIAACLLFGVAYGVGTFRIRSITYEQPPHLPLLRLVQGNIPQDLKWNPQLKEQHLKAYLKLSRSVNTVLPQIIIWPEAAVPFLLEPESGLTNFLGRFLTSSQILLAGILRRENQEVYNSLLVTDAPGTVLAVYDKKHILPFGEYIPFRKFLPLKRIAKGLGLSDISPGEKTRLLNIPGIPPAAVFICYEAAFARDRPFAEHRVDWLLNITNDAWFGHTSEPYQHAHICRFRAIESGAPLVRIANTGKTCVFTALGEEIVSLPLSISLYKDCLLPLRTEFPTFFSRLGSIPLIVFLCFLSFFFHGASNKIKK